MKKIFSTLIILLVVLSARQVLSCGSKETRVVSFVRGEKEGFLNMETRDENGNLLKITEDDGGFLAAFYTVDYLKLLPPDKDGNIDFSKYKEHIFFLKDRINRLAEDVLSTGQEPPVENAIRMRLDRMKNVLATDKIHQGEMDKAWKAIVTIFMDANISMNTRFKKSASDEWDEESLNMSHYFQIRRQRGCGPGIKLDISKRGGKTSSGDDQGGSANQ